MYGQPVPGVVNFIVVRVGNIELMLRVSSDLDQASAWAGHTYGWHLPVCIEEGYEALSPGLEAFCLGLFVGLRIVLDMLVSIRKCLGAPLVRCRWWADSVL